MRFLICRRTLALDSDSTGVWPHFAIPVLTLVPPNAPLPESGVLKQTYDLTCASNTFATRRSIGSMLAGPGSESDDFADVGFWCGKIDEADKEASLLHTLSLSSWIYTGTVSSESDPLLAEAIPDEFFHNSFRFQGWVKRH